MTYASETNVSVEKSRAEIERTLNRYGASKFASYHDEQKAIVEFYANDRRVRFVLQLPDRMDQKFAFTAHRHERRSDDARLKAWEHACRSRWRSLALAIKAKLECVSTGIAQFEDEFLANIVDPVTNQTVGNLMREQIQLRYSDNPHTAMLALPAPD